jgi:hypothetical protein
MQLEQNLRPNYETTNMVGHSLFKSALEPQKVCMPKIVKDLSITETEAESITSTTKNAKRFILEDLVGTGGQNNVRVCYDLHTDKRLVAKIPKEPKFEKQLKEEHRIMELAQGMKGVL